MKIMKVKRFFKSNIITKLSVLVMGLGHFCRKQKIVGLLYLSVQVIFILYMSLFGGKYIVMFFQNFFTGGNVGFKETQISNEWNSELGEYTKIPGDNSFHIVLYGILTIFIILFFVLFDSKIMTKH